jgi:hypothetical protein
MMRVTGGAGGGEDAIFYRFAGGPGSMAAAHAGNVSTPISETSLLPNAAFFSTSPIDGLFVGLLLQGMFPNTELDKIWRLMHIGAGYEIPNIGHIRAQYIGGFSGKQKAGKEFNLTDAAKFEAAFAYTGLDNFLIDMGAKFWLPLESTAGNRAYKGIDVAVAARYQTGDFNIAAMGQVLSIGAYTGLQMHTNDSTLGADGLHFTFSTAPGYDFSFGSLGLSFIGQTKLANTDPLGVKNERSAWTRFGAGVWYRKDLDRGSITIGAAYAAPQIGFGNPPSSLGSDGRPVVPPPQTGFNQRGIFTIPIIVDYWFF